MGKCVLIAEMREIVRSGLRNIFVEDTRVSEIHEVTNNQDLQNYLTSHKIDLLIVHQQLVTDVALFPENHFIILTHQPDITLLKAAYAHKALGYLSENVSADFLRTILCFETNTFIIDPTLTSWLMDSFFCDQVETLSEKQVLSPREREIYDLLEEGVERRNIANKLCISEATLKTHIRNIARKLKLHHDDELLPSEILTANKVEFIENATLTLSQNRVAG